MKNLKRYKCILIPAIFTLVLVVTACDNGGETNGGDNGNGGGNGGIGNPFVGSWRNTIYGTTTTITFGSNMSFSQMTSGTTVSFSGRYTYSGDTATITVSGSTVTAVLSSGNTLVYSGYTFTKW